MTKKQKKNYKNAENNLRKKLNLKEKEVNDLRVLLNTNISIKSQISSIIHDGKDEENSKEIREIKTYNDSINANKNYHRIKSLSLIERKVSSYSCINKRNSLYNNKSNKSYNCKNISRHGIKNTSKSKKDNKYRTIANIFFRGNNTKKLKEENSIKVMKNYIKPFFYSNYNSASSFRGNKLDKSESRSIISRKTISKSKINLPEESNNSKNILINENKCENNSNKHKKENELNSNKNKIMINYNTNIINANVSIDKLTIKQKIREIRKAIDEKINELTRNKRHSIRKTISAIYGKKSKSPFFTEKIKKQKVPAYRYNEQRLQSNKLLIKSRKKFQTSGYNNSNYFRQRLQNCTIQHKNKIKFKNNSMLNINNINIKNETNKNKDKIMVIQEDSGKKSGGTMNICKNNDKTTKIKNYSSVAHFNNKINISGKSQNIENDYKTIINNHHFIGLSYRKNNNFENILPVNEKSNKNDNKLKKKKCDIHTNNNHKSNNSLRKYFFNKCISSSNAENKNYIYL